jgi:hypothetical protein
MVRIYGTQDQKEFSNEFWYTISAGSPPSNWDQHAAAGALYSAIGTPLVATMSSGCTLLGCEFYYNNGSGTLGVDYYSKLTDSLSIAGIPEDVAVVVQKITANATKQGRGRWYFAGVGVTLIANSYLTSSGITAYQALATQLKTAVTDQGVTYSPAHFSPGLGMLLPLVDCPVVALLATRRRRRFGF